MIPIIFIFNDLLHSAEKYELPRVFYHSGGFKDCRFEIGPRGVLATNAGLEFPWKFPGGRMDANVVRLVHPPGLKPKWIGNKVIRAPNGTGSGGLLYGNYQRVAWEWPVGATFFEVHYHRELPFEVRMLRKVRDGYGFETYEHHRFVPWDSKAEMEKSLGVKLNGVERREKMVAKHPYNRFEAEGVVEYFSGRGIDWKKALEGRTWVEAGGWHHSGMDDEWLTPKGYFGWALEDCSKCHKHAGVPVETFELFRDWYGFVPGADGVFSYHTVDPRYIYRDARPGVARFK